MPNLRHKCTRTGPIANTMPKSSNAKRSTPSWRTSTLISSSLTHRSSRSSKGSNLRSNLKKTGLSRPRSKTCLQRPIKVKCCLSRIWRTDMKAMVKVISPPTEKRPPTTWTSKNSTRSSKITFLQETKIWIKDHKYRISLWTNYKTSSSSFQSLSSNRNSSKKTTSNSFSRSSPQTTKDYLQTTSSHPWGTTGPLPAVAEKNKTDMETVSLPEADRTTVMVLRLSVPSRINNKITRHSKTEPTTKASSWASTLPSKSSNSPKTVTRPSAFKVFWMLVTQSLSWIKRSHFLEREGPSIEKTSNSNRSLRPTLNRSSWIRLPSSSKCIRTSLRNRTRGVL